MYPKVKFKIDKDLDKWKISEFLFHDEEKDELQKLIYSIHPKLKNFKNINKYIDELYDNDLVEFEKNKTKIQTNWDKLATNFFNYQNNIYNNLPWPYEDFIGSLSISPPYPRFINLAAFQVNAYSAEDSMTIIAHELGHFIFFEYVRDRYTPKTKKLDEEKLNQELWDKLKIPLWELSEVHVVMLMQTPEFQEFLPNQSRPYPRHEEYFKECNKYWKKANGDIDKFFDILEK